MEDEPDLENDDSEDVKSVVGRLRALQSVTIFVQVKNVFQSEILCKEI